MLLGERLRRIRQWRDMTQGDLYRLTGILPIRISTIERGNTMPTIATVERLSTALRVPLWKIFYEERVGGSSFPPRSAGGYGSHRKQARAIEQLRVALSKMIPRERRILLATARAMLREK
jgi:transcriptional regulator with XRE-family HTH domain